MSNYHGSSFFRQRLILSSLSGKPIVIKDIRDAYDEPGLNKYEESFLKLLGTLTDGAAITIMESGTVVKYMPGLLLGGKLQHDCGTERAIGYFLEPLLCLAPFCKKPLQITLRGITNDNVDPSVDAIKYSSLPVLKRFIKNDKNLEVKIISRGLPPEGGGEVLFTCPVINTVCKFEFLNPGKIKRVMGYAYSVGVAPAMASRMVEKSKKLLLKFLPDVFIYTDHCNVKDSERGSKVKKSPGFGLILVAESTTGVFYSAEAVSNPSGSKGDLVVEDVAQQACFNPLPEQSDSSPITGTPLFREYFQQPSIFLPQPPRNLRRAATFLLFILRSIFRPLLPKNKAFGANPHHNLFSLKDTLPPPPRNPPAQIQERVEFSPFSPQIAVPVVCELTTVDHISTQLEHPVFYFFFSCGENLMEIPLSFAPVH